MRRLAAGLAATGVGLAVLAGVAAILAGPGTGWGWWHFGTGFAVLRWGAWAGLAAVGLAAVGLGAALAARQRRSACLALAALLAGSATFGVPWMLRRGARLVPPIHDVSTDTEDPPVFVAIVPLRLSAPNGVTPAGPDVAALQHRAYPDLAPLDLPVSPTKALAACEAAARRLGWAIAAVAPGEGRLEATATTPWFRFRDDVVVRVRPRSEGSRVDVRSASRVGRSDLGVNAARIRRFLGLVREVVGK